MSNTNDPKRRAGSRNIGLMGAMLALAALGGTGPRGYELPARKPTKPSEKTPADIERIAAAEAKRARKAARKGGAK